MHYTPKQLEILRLIKRSQKEKGYSPTYSELGDIMGVTPVTIFEHIKALIDKGAIRIRKYQARSIEIIDADFDKTISNHGTDNITIKMIAKTLEPAFEKAKGLTDNESVPIKVGDLKIIMSLVDEKVPIQ